jgi:hypothetical protein
MMSKKSRAEVIAAVRERYWKAKKAQTTQDCAQDTLAPSFFGVCGAFSRAC